MAEDMFIQLIEKTHAEVQEHRRQQGLPPYPFRQINPMPLYGVLQSLETKIMEGKLCACNCGNYLTPAEVARGKEYKWGHKDKKAPSYREGAIRRGAVLNAPKPTNINTEVKLTFPRMLRFAEVELATAQRDLERATQDAFDASNRAGASKAKIEKLQMLILSLKEIVPNENDLPSGTNGGVQRPGSPQLAQPGNKSAEGQISISQPNDAGLSGPERFESVGDPAHC